MTLRRSYAVQCLRDGMNVREVQECLGHQHLETTLQYRRYLSANGAVFPVGSSVVFHPQSPESPAVFSPALTSLQSSGA